jgi:hypothetical protein
MSPVMSFTNNLTPLSDRSNAAIALLGELDPCFLIGFAHLEEKHLAVIDSLQRIFQGTPLAPSLEAIGKEYYEYRAQLMVANNQGLTATYNRFHDPDEYDPAILKLRDLHNQMDRAVLDAYGWKDIQPVCEFLLDYEDEEEEPLTPDPSPTRGDGSKRRAKKALSLSLGRRDPR